MKGLVDFTYMPLEEGREPRQGWIYIQVDGSSHFKDTRGVLVHKQLDKDMLQCEVALSAGSRLIRLHHADLQQLQEIMKAAEQQCDMPFVLLSPGFAVVKAWGQEKQLGVPYVLQERLTGKAHMEIDAQGCFWFWPN